MATRSTQRNLGRLSEIVQVAGKHGFGYFFETHRALPFRRREELDGDRSQRGVHLREMLDELGPTFVKFGQALSMRPDVLPPDIIAELRGLQDDVKPFPFEQVEQIVSEELGLTIEQLFLEFEPTPVASASIGQVHRAVLPNGRRVAVKVQRPGAPRQIDADLALMMQAAQARAGAREARSSSSIRAALVDEFARQIRHELDYRLEARNAEAFRRDFAGHPHVVVPRVYWSYTRSRVLTLELLEGPQLADIGPDDFTVEERRHLAYLITETWMTMIFRHGFFHGDPHPANILVLGPDRIGLVDFGAVGKLTDADMSAATGLFIDAATENVDALPKRLTDLGVQYPKEREAQFRSELREIYYRYYGASLAEIDPMQVIREAFQLIYSVNLHLPTRFLMLDKAIATLASVGAELYPDFNVFEVAKPFARDLMRERFTPTSGSAGAQGGGRALADRPRAALPGARHPRGDAGRPDRGRLPPPRARRVHGEHAAVVQPARDRARGRSRLPGLGGAGGVREGRASCARGQRDRAGGLRPLDDRAVPAPLGRGPFRPFVDRSSQFRAKGHLASGRGRR